MNPLIGIGLRPPHYDEIRHTLPRVGWLEVHSENYFERHSQGFEVLAELARHYPVSLHGVGMSLGSADPLDAGHLRQLAALVAAARVQATVVDKALGLALKADSESRDVLGKAATESAP